MKIAGNVYHIQLHGQVDLKELNELSPHQMTSAGAAANTTSFTVCTDQSGLIGILSYLNNRGLIFLRIQRGDQKIVT